jgi:hypothetical protein
MPQEINPFADKSIVSSISGTTYSGLPQFKANVTIAYVAADTEITVTPSSLAANYATIYNVQLIASNGTVKNININLASPAAVTVDLSGVTDFDLTKPFSFSFVAHKENETTPLQFGGNINPLQDYTKPFNNL